MQSTLCLTCLSFEQSFSQTFCEMREARHCTSPQPHYVYVLSSCRLQWSDAKFATLPFCFTSL